MHQALGRQIQPATDGPHAHPVEDVEEGLWPHGHELLALTEQRIHGFVGRNVRESGLAVVMASCLGGDLVVRDAFGDLVRVAKRDAGQRALAKDLSRGVDAVHGHGGVGRGGADHLVGGFLR
ncbi:MAG: hypothetical protein E6I45_04990 [Chloroflexi bacterium]|nr:MAG: hypothetical protein E6I45_04990 [Chloroflexota bacterium]